MATGLLDYAFARDCANADLEWRCAHVYIGYHLDDLFFFLFRLEAFWMLPDLLLKVDKFRAIVVQVVHNDGETFGY